MPTYTDQDSDAGRLPPGFTRTGYDADTEIYTYTDENGSSYSGLPGNRYGTLYPTGSAEYHNALRSGDPMIRELRKTPWWRRDDWSYISRFLLIVGLVLVTLVWWINRDSSGVSYACGESEVTHTVVRGDTCWAVAKEYDLKVDDLMGPFVEGEEHNRISLQCDDLRYGDLICVPRAEKAD